MTEFCQVDSTKPTRRRLLGDAARLAAALAAMFLPPNVRRALAAPHRAGELAVRNQARRSADAGESLVRSLFRHDGGRAQVSTIPTR